MNATHHLYPLFTTTQAIIQPVVSQIVNWTALRYRKHFRRDRRVSTWDFYDINESTVISQIMTHNWYHFWFWYLEANKAALLLNSLALSFICSVLSSSLLSFSPLSSSACNRPSGVSMALMVGASQSTRFFLKCDFLSLPAFLLFYSAAWL